MNRKVRCPHCNKTYRRAISLTEQLLEGSALNQKQLLFLFSNRCALQISDQCPGQFSDIEEATIDHIIPIGKGGLNRFENKQLACKPCNSMKADKLPQQIDAIRQARATIKYLTEGTTHDNYQTNP